MVSVSVVFLVVASASAFAPPGRVAFSAHKHVGGSARHALDPSIFQDIHQHVDSLPDAFASMTLSDAADAVGDASSSTADAVSAVAAGTDGLSTAASGADAASTAAASNGWFGFLTGPIEGLLTLINGALVAMGVTNNAWGISIIAMTVMIKVLTFPLTKTQLESTNKMQALQPTIKEIQNRYQSNPEVMNQKIAEVYQENQVNPLAGCLPSLAQIPIFIGLYRAVLTLAKENKLDESFLWLPSLEGPTYGADPQHASDWILKGWVDGVPSLGWDDTLAFLTLPVFLVISQFVSMQLMQPKTTDPAQQQSNAILKFLPFMIGYFSLNVPSALGIYWVVNNIITTATTLVLRNSMEPVSATTSSPGGATAASPAIFSPPPEKPAGFGEPSAFDTSSNINPITSIDAEIVSSEIEEDNVVQATSDGGMGSGTRSQPKKKRSGKKKKKRKN